MKSTTIALIAAFLADKISASNGAMVTRAMCMAKPYDEAKTNLSENVSGSTRLSQKIKGDDEGPIKVWSNWRDADESDSYSLTLIGGDDCFGAYGPALEEGAKIKVKGKSGKIGIRGEIVTDFTLADLVEGNDTSVALLNADGDPIACCFFGTPEGGERLLDDDFLQ